MDEWVKISIPHTLEYHSVINRRNLVVCDTMDAPEGYHVKWNVRQRKTSTVWSHMKSKQTIFNNTEKRTSLVVQWLRLCPSTAGDTGSIPGRGSSTCCVVWSKTTTTTTKTTETKPSQKKKKIENRLVAVRDGECSVKGIGEHSQKVQTSKKQRTSERRCVGGGWGQG